MRFDLICWTSFTAFYKGMTSPAIETKSIPKVEDFTGQFYLLFSSMRGYGYYWLKSLFFPQKVISLEVIDVSAFSFRRSARAFFAHLWFSLTDKPIVVFVEF